MSKHEAGQFFSPRWINRMTPCVICAASPNYDASSKSLGLGSHIRGPNGATCRILLASDSALYSIAIHEWDLSLILSLFKSRLKYLPSKVPAPNIALTPASERRPFRYGLSALVQCST